MMPNLNGYDFVKQLRSIDGHAATTGDRGVGSLDGEWAVRAGGNAIPFKAVPSRQLIALINELLVSGGGAR